MSERLRLYTESNANREPFLIRAHHLVLFVNLSKGTITPDDLSNQLKTDMHNDLNDALREQSSIKEHALQQIRYGRDVLGYTEDDADKVAANDLKLFKKFKELPADYPVDIVEGQKDEICKGCRIGKHCTLRQNEEEFGPGNLAETDEIYLNYFLRDASKTDSRKAGIEVITEYVEFSDAKPQRMRRLKTTAGVVKAVLSNWKDL